MAISESELERIVRRVVGELLDGAPERAVGGGAPPAPSTGRDPLAATGRHGLFATVDEAVAAARTAQRALAKGGVGLRRRAIDAIREVGVRHAEDLARAAHEETGLGRVRDKIAKNEFAATASVGVEDLAPRAFAGEHGLAIEDWLPWGVVASVTPTNSPSAFMVNHGITMLAGGNAVVFNAHPGCKWTSMRTVELMNQAVVAGGGPDNLMTGVVAPTLETATGLVQHPGVDMLCITGGAALVRDAFGTGKRVIAAGPGLPVSVLDETADPRRAAEEIFRGAVFENTILCIGEKAVVAAERTYGPLLEAFGDLPARILTADEVERVYAAVIDDRGGHPTTRREFVGRDAEVLLAAAGLESRKPVGLLVAPVEREHPLFPMEQFCPFLPVVRTRDSAAAIDLAIEVEGGNRHTAMIYSNYPPNVERFAREASTVITVVNGNSLRGLGVDGEGYPGFAIGTVTGEGVTTPRHFCQARRVSHVHG
jgi:acyl-CoA reductase-like NAD-dependent aldehyde dehydrogenase